MPEQTDDRADDRSAGEDKRDDVERLAPALDGQDDAKGAGGAGHAAERGEDDTAPVDAVAAQEG